MAAPTEDVYCTLVMTDSYLSGAAVLAYSLRDNGTTKKLAALITEADLSPATVAVLKNIYDYVIPVERISNPSLANLARLGRLDLRYAFTKIALWNQTQFRKIVYIDADVVALRAPDELFDLPASFAAAPDIGWPDCFNSGVMLLTPDESEYQALKSLAAGGVSFDGADQGLLNEYYANKPWQRLSFQYNCTPSASYQYEPAYRHYKNDIKMVHFIGTDKPWKRGRQALHSEQAGVYKELLGVWWAVYDRHFTAVQKFPTEKHDQATRIVKQYVAGEQSTGFEWASAGLTRDSTPQPAPVQETKHEEPQREKRVRFADGPQPEPPRVASPPQQRWDATRDAPPSASGPEAGNFPSTHYSMSKSGDLFHAPKEYPEAPKDMWYEVPSSKPQPSARPKPIFPWEKTNTARPTRVFDDEEPEYQPEPTPSFQELSSPKSPPTPTITVTSSDPWGGFSSRNAWDNDSSIDKYVQGLKQSAFRGNVQVLHHDSRQQSPQTGSASSSTRSTPAPNRKAYKTADLTSLGDLPSMPVTPAVSYRKQVFWGSDEPTAARGSQLPEAQGVPEQSLWVCPRCDFVVPISELWRMLSNKAASAQAKPQSPPRMKPYTAPTVPPGASSPPSLSFVPSFPPNRHAASSVPSRMANASPFSRTPSPPSFTTSPEHRRSHPKAGIQANSTFTLKNPMERLEELRRTSIATANEPDKLPLSSPTSIPTRDMPTSSAPLPAETSTGVRWEPPAIMSPTQEQSQEAKPQGSDYIDSSALMSQGKREAEGEYGSSSGGVSGGSRGGAGQPSAAALQASFGASPALVQGERKDSITRVHKPMGEYDLA